MWKGKRPDFWIISVTILIWVIIHLVNSDRFINHDSWRHIFPVIFAVSRDTTCTGLPSWLTVDAGVPIITHVPSFSLMQIFRLPTLYLMGCLQLPIVPSIYLHKIELFTTYFIFSLGMYNLGNQLFQHQLSKTYLLVATLFAGLCLENFHSSQVMSELFWIPWVIGSGVSFHRTLQGWYLNAGVLFLSFLMLDHYPQMPILITIIGLSLYIILYGSNIIKFLKSDWISLWPSLAILIITTLQLLIFRDQINQQISLFRSLELDPQSLPPTGFVQPSALLASFFPLTFLKGYDILQTKLSEGLIYHLNSIVFYLGFIPLVMVINFILRPGFNRLKIWWGGFTLILFLISLQNTKLYYLIYHLPFFNTFRGYFLYILFVVFGILIMSAYGIDTYLSIEPKQRKKLLQTSLAIAIGITLIAFIILSQLLPLDAKQIFYLFRTDLIMLFTSAIALWWVSREKETQITVIIITLILTQTLYFIGIYQRTSIPIDQLIIYYQLQPYDYAKIPKVIPVNPYQYKRSECVVFPQCYLSESEAISIEPVTFLRPQQDPIHQRLSIASAVIKSLSGITHPIFWLSLSVIPYKTQPELIESLNKQKNNLTPYLTQATYIHYQDLAKLPLIPTLQPNTTYDFKLNELRRNSDYYKISYQSNVPILLNGAINYNPNWKATLNGKPTPLVRGNFNGLTVSLPSGSGIVELKYQSWENFFFFSTRYISLILAILIIVETKSPNQIH